MPYPTSPSKLLPPMPSSTLPFSFYLPFPFPLLYQSFPTSQVPPVFYSSRLALSISSACLALFSFVAFQGRLAISIGLLLPSVVLLTPLVVLLAFAFKGGRPHLGILQLKHR